MTLVDHLEAHLGQIAEGWGDRSKIQVVRFPNQPEAGVDTYCSLGLSDTVLSMPGDRAVRQELIISVQATYSSEQVASLVLSFAEFIRSHGRALLRGDVVGPSDPILPGVRARSLYAAIPVFFEDEFATYRDSQPPTVFVWLIPQPAEEAEFVKDRGWEVYEDRLETESVDFWNLDRPGLS